MTFDNSLANNLSLPPTIHAHTYTDYSYPKQTYDRPDPEGESAPLPTVDGQVDQPGRSLYIGDSSQGRRPSGSSLTVPLASLLRPIDVTYLGYTDSDQINRPSSLQSPLNTGQLGPSPASGTVYLGGEVFTQAPRAGSLRPAPSREKHGMDRLMRSSTSRPLIGSNSTLMAAEPLDGEYLGWPSGMKTIQANTPHLYLGGDYLLSKEEEGPHVYLGRDYEEEGEKCIEDGSSGKK
ncbi:unnamed protein product [Protopolystoma xenopodis]|uniref:Uncharacterized protein n=1 Tax=Protopolystoma xenopodis TaxID=117903 RepID=A0A3S5A6J8_9PLAT|nr:unnamed protein product [Protopolystoma xenopodis]